MSADAANAVVTDAPAEVAVYGAEAPFLPLFQAFKLSQPSSISRTPLPPPAMSDGTLPGSAQGLSMQVRWWLLA